MRFNPGPGLVYFDLLCVESYGDEAELVSLDIDYEEESNHGVDASIADHAGDEENTKVEDRTQQNDSLPEASETNYGEQLDAPTDI